jgi:RNA polymerase sigma-70 factor, ECF subfamily
MYDLVSHLQRSAEPGGLMRAIDQPASLGAAAADGAEYVEYRAGRAPASKRNIGHYANALREALSIVALDQTSLGAGAFSASGPEADADLMRAVARKDRRAFEALYYTYSPRLGRYLLRLLKRHDLVDEVINDVMLVAWESAARYDASLARLSTWLFGIAHNKALKALAGASRHKAEVAFESDFAGEGIESDDSDDAATRADPHNPEQTLMGRQLGRALQQAVESLSPEHRAVVELAFAEDCSYQEIAQVLECPVNTVKTRMFYARKHLAELLAKHRSLDC